jgi:YHS domain-containing protein
MTNLHGSHNAGIFSSQHLLSILAVLVNAVMGPVLAFISFVCSVGNVPLAAALWSSGASFGGVIAFIFADLVSFPLVAIYFKYYGKRVSVKLVLTFWAVMSLSGVITQAIFAALKLLPAKRTIMAMSSSHFGANATTYLNFLALIIFIVVLVLYRQGLAAAKNSTESEFAQDPICLMQVRKANAPASAHVDGVDYYFCMEGCKTKFLSNVAAGK